eukprot:scaffold1954_cov268-Pinguiococcus_pyrenoidosus.AAC.141
MTRLPFLRRSDGSGLCVGGCPAISGSCGEAGGFGFGSGSGSGSKQIRSGSRVNGFQIRPMAVL